MYHPVDETAQAVGVASQTVRNWISSGFLQIPCYTGLTKHDVITVMIAAELSNLGIGPKLFEKIVPQVVHRVIKISIMLDATWQNYYDLDFVEKQLQEATSPQCIHHIKDKINRERYCIIYYYKNDDGNALKCIFVNNNMLNDEKDTTRIMIDLLEFSRKANRILAQLPIIEKG